MGLTDGEKLREAVARIFAEVETLALGAPEWDGSVLPGNWEMASQTLRTAIDHLGITREMVELVGGSLPVHDATCTGYLDGACDCDGWLPRANAIDAAADALSALLDGAGK